MTLLNNMKGNTNMYITIMKNAIMDKLKKAEKPDLSLKDWEFIWESLNALENIVEHSDEEYPEYFQDDVLNILKDYEGRTKHEIL